MIAFLIDQRSLYSSHFDLKKQTQNETKQNESAGLLKVTTVAHREWSEPNVSLSDGIEDALGFACPNS